MATVAQFNQDPNNQGQQQNTGGGGQVLNSTGAGGSGGGAGGSSAYQAPRAPSGAPNIQQYMQANQGAGQQLSQGIQNNVQNQANQIGQGISSAQNQLNTQYQPLQQNLSQGQQTIQSAFQNPQQLLDAYNASKTQSSNQPLSNDQQNSLNQYNQFQQLNSGGYNPAIAGYGSAAQQQTNNLQNQVAGLNQTAGSAANEMGRFQLLQNTVGQPNYSTGQQTLDELFLQAQPGVANQLQQNIGNIAQQAGQNVAGFSGDTQSKLAALQGLSGQNQQLAQNLFQNGTPGATATGQEGLNQIGSNVQNELSAAQAAAPGQLSALQQAAANNKGFGSFNAQQLSQLGLTPGQQAWGVGLGNFIQAGTPATAAGVASPEEFARYNALNQLAGGPAGTVQPGIFGGATQAGGYNPVNFNTQGFNTAVSNAQQAMNHSDLVNALQPIAGQGGDLAQIVNPIIAGVNSGKINADQAQQMLQQQVAATQNAYGGNSGQANFLTNAISPFTSWYNQTYQPAAGDVLGAALPSSGLGSNAAGNLVGK